MQFRRQRNNLFIDLSYTWGILHVSTHKGSSSGVFSYTLLITELQSEIPIFLFTYIDHKLATYVYLHTI
jgi:hypothetical protein